MVMKKIDEIEKNGNGVTSHFLKRTLSPKNIGHINTMISNLPDSIVHEIEYGGLGGFWAKFLSRFGIFAKYFTSSIWLYNVNVDETLLKYFRPHMHIDFPALRSYRIREHTRLASIMVKAIRDLTRYLKRCNKFTWKRHHKNKRRLMNAIGRNKFKFILFFTPIADAIGHLNFTDEWVMREIYWELDDLVRRLNNEHRVV
jgi:hypothetical protein